MGIPFPGEGIREPGVELIGEFYEGYDSGYDGVVEIPRRGYSIPKYYQGNLYRILFVGTNFHSQGGSLE